MHITVHHPKKEKNVIGDNKLTFVQNIKTVIILDTLIYSLNNSKNLFFVVFLFFIKHNTYIFMLYLGFCYPTLPLL